MERLCARINRQAYNNRYTHSRRVSNALPTNITCSNIAVCMLLFYAYTPDADQHKTSLSNHFSFSLVHRNTAYHAHSTLHYLLFEEEIMIIKVRRGCIRRDDQWAQDNKRLYQHRKPPILRRCSTSKHDRSIVAWWLHFYELLCIIMCVPKMIKLKRIIVVAHVLPIFRRPHRRAPRAKLCLPQNSRCGCISNTRSIYIF